jgi:hypothetical protein
MKLYTEVENTNTQFPNHIQERLKVKNRQIGNATHYETYFTLPLVTSARKCVLVSGGFGKYG